jgi:colicin import membrane protein
MKLAGRCSMIGSTVRSAPPTSGSRGMGLTALALGVCLFVAGAAQAADAQRQALADERAVIEAGHEAEAAACRRRFAVNDCLDRALARRRAALEPLREQEWVLDEQRRRDRAAAREAAIVARQQAAERERAERAERAAQAEAVRAERAALAAEAARAGVADADAGPVPAAPDRGPDATAGRAPLGGTAAVGRGTPRAAIDPAAVAAQREAGVDARAAEAAERVLAAQRRQQRAEEAAARVQARIEAQQARAERGRASEPLPVPPIGPGGR